MTVPADPLVVTLHLDDAGASFFETARQQHFPVDRNQIPAHVSPFRAHITVQNKVDGDAARQTHADLEAAFEPFETVATGLELWWYRGGPWAPADVVPFAGAA